MRRLFLQFYISVLVILICTGLIYFIVISQRNSVVNWQKIEQAMSGGVRLAAEQLKDIPEDERTDKLAAIQNQLDFPASIVSFNTVPGYVNWQLNHGRSSVMFVENNEFYQSAKISDEPVGELLLFGPMPKVVGPSQIDIAVGLILVLSLMAIAIYLALLPMTRQLRQMEQTIMSFARGKLETRAIEDPAGPMFELAQAFNVMAARTENLVRTQRELLQAVSHELRTPLSRVHFGLDLARQAITEDDREDRLVSIENAAGELDDLVGELLRYVRMESNETLLEIVETPVRLTLKELFDGQQVIHQNISFTIEPEKADEIFIQADRINFRRAMSNLISNAGKYAKSKVVVSVSEIDDQVEISIADDGPGVPAEDADRIFEPFVRLSETKKGVGLGLALVRRIAQRHNAQISTCRSPWGGLQLKVLWPLKSI